LVINFMIFHSGVNKRKHPTSKADGSRLIKFDRCKPRRENYIKKQAIVDDKCRAGYTKNGRCRVKTKHEKRIDRSKTTQDNLLTAN